MISKRKEKFLKKFFVSAIIPFELVPLYTFVLRREYFSFAVNVLRTSLKILLITKRDLSQPNCLHSDQ